METIKEKVKILTCQMQEKAERLCLKAERSISVLDIPESTVKSINTSSSLPINIGYLTAAGLSFVGILCENHKTIPFLGAVVAAGFGYFESKRKVNISYNNNLIDVNKAKSLLNKQVIDTTKEIATDWENFISVRQKELNRIVENSSLENEEKQNIISKLFFYETIKVDFSVFDEIINSLKDDCSNFDMVKSQLVDCLKTYVNKVVANQIAVYKSFV